MAGILDILTIDQIDDDHFITRVVDKEFPGLYGGQVAAQSLLAACRTISEHQVPHSLHAYFLRAGRSAVPIELQVFRDRDGRSYAARRIVATQSGEVIFNMSASFHELEDGPDVQAVSMPSVLPPLTENSQPVPRGSDDIELVNASPNDEHEMPYRTWTRARIELPDDPHIHACVLTYVSDFYTGLVQFEEFPKNPRVASLDHAMWFYRAVNMNHWHLMDWQAQSMANGRGHYVGHIYDDQGRLVAGLGQEMVVRAART
ncbi:MAG: acyl-CoA thioesterase domain-containing protein [Candidatus Nanopelagicales bacterium]